MKRVFALLVAVIVLALSACSPATPAAPASESTTAPTFAQPQSAPAVPDVGYYIADCVSQTINEAIQDAYEDSLVINEVDNATEEAQRWAERNPGLQILLETDQIEVFDGVSVYQSVVGNRTYQYDFCKVYVARDPENGSEGYRLMDITRSTSKTVHLYQWDREAGAVKELAETDANGMVMKYLGMYK